MTRVLRNARILTPEGIVIGWLQITDGVVARLGPGDPPAGLPDAEDLRGHWLAPGFVDIQRPRGRRRLLPVRRTARRRD